MMHRAELPFEQEAGQNMGMAALRKHHWTAADVRALIAESRPSPRYELLHGELLVTPAPTAAHQLAVLDLAARLREYCGSEGVGVALMSPADIELAPESVMQPDVFVIPNAAIPADEPLRWPHVRSLLLAVEVLSPGSMRQDRVEKREFYLANNVDEYWIVDLDARVIERWTPELSTPDLRRDEVVWRPRGSAIPFRLDVAAFFASNPALPRHI